jgi:hypothetical protein
MLKFRALIVLCVLVLAPAIALAQGGYFGRNKVQYRQFDFKVLKTEHFDIYFYPEEESAARMTARLAERWYARLSKLLDHQLRTRQAVVLYASNPHFWQTTVLEGAVSCCRWLVRFNPPITCSATSSSMPSSTTSPTRTSAPEMPEH